MRWKLLSVLLLNLLILSSFSSANIVKNSSDKACQPVNYWVFKNGGWIEKSEPRVWWYCQEPEKAEGFEGFAFKEMPYGLFKKPDPMTLHQAARDLTGLVGINELQGKFSTDLPSYGGMFINEGKGLIFVYVKDEEGKDKIKQALEKYRGKVNVVFLRGKYSFKQLVKWKHLIEKLNSKTIKQLGITMIDADEAHNSLTIGLEEVTPEILRSLESELKKLGIPKEAVRVEKRKYMRPNINTDLIRPLIGGIQIVNKELGGIGTLGYVGYYNNEKYAITAGHFGVYGTNGQHVYQPDTSSEEYYIGQIEYNPFFRDSGSVPYRYSDSLLIHVTNADISPEIYTNGNVIGKKYSTEQYVGEIVYKVGRTTGKTSGSIINKCVTSVMQYTEEEQLKYGYPSTAYFYCQMETTFYAAGGDSGAPVYHNYRNEAAVIYGVYWGGTDTVSAYSPIDGIEKDLGIVLDVT
ncbi:protease [Thermococcus sp. 21S7]|uniref:protease n=1 Tax=Thermococcus sp. 21S7 TaxID=1638221 RepID=UPI0014398EFE|nr:protease [Thermococcus sp. 21S7]NJE60298.1 protease [Thermococcus sp. 21S7]